MKRIASKLGLSLALIFPMAALLVACEPAEIVVTTTNDELNNDGDCSLREAVQASNTDTKVDACQAGDDADVIQLKNGTYRLSVAGTREQENRTGDLDFLDDVEIRGQSIAGTVIDGLLLDRVVDVFPGVGLTASDLTLTRGLSAPGRRGGAMVALEGAGVTLQRVRITASAVQTGPDRINDGGAIYNNGTMSILNSQISGNQARGDEGSGGGIWNSGAMLIERSTIAGNRSFGKDGAGLATDGGGGIVNVGSLEINGSTISGNTAATRGGGIANTGTLTVQGTTINDNQAANGGAVSTVAGTTSLVNITISGNRATVHGGGLYTTAAAVVASDSIVLNLADFDRNGSGDGGGIFVGGGLTQLRNSLFNENDDFGREGPGCRTAGGELRSGGYNKLGTTGCTLTGDLTGNIVGGDAGIGPLQANGGPTATHALDPDSPLIDRGSPKAVASGGNACPAVDQRAVPRPADGDGNGTARCDIGAFELVP